jgi:hypothetical protein
MLSLYFHSWDFRDLRRKEPSNEFSRIARRITQVIINP